jgi:glycosyltransferase involved in cell wall biosynthesis
MMPSETFGIVNIEAMLMGLPIVTFGTFGQGEYLTVPWGKAEAEVGGGEEGSKTVGHHSGKKRIEENTVAKNNAVVVTQPSAQSLSEAVVLLLRNATQRRERGMAARMTVLKEYTSQHSGYGFYGVYREIMMASAS